MLARETGVDIDYVALVDPDTFENIDTFEEIGASGRGSRAGVLAVAARVGATRLIDNELVELTW